MHRNSLAGYETLHALCAEFRCLSPNCPRDRLLPAALLGIMGGESDFKLTPVPAGQVKRGAIMIAKLFLLTAGLLSGCVAQTFEVASVRASQFQSSDGEGGRRESIEVSGDRLTMRNVTLRSCIGWAYSIQDFQISGAPDTDRFDISARAAAPATNPALRRMLGALLADRFKLRFHQDTKNLPFLALVLAKGGPKISLAQEDGPGVLQPTRGAMVARHASMSEFTASLTGPLRMPVIDKTGLTGRYDFTIDLSSEFADLKPGEQPDIVVIVTSALRRQAGLSLESRKGPVEILVIDHVEKNPSGN
jgi:uncharacterized protein (TIGR03435 family)